MRRIRSLLFAVIFTVLFFVFLEFAAHVVEFISPPVDSMSRLGIPEKQPSTYRIFIYGDSTVYGTPIRPFGFVAQLEFWLRKIHPEKSLEVFNFGVRGSPSADVRRRVEESIAYEPDLLIVLSAHNEFLNRSITGSLDKAYRKLALIRVVARMTTPAWAALFPGFKNALMPTHIEGYDRESALFKQKVQIYLNNLKSIVEASKQNKKPLSLITAPSNLSDWPPVYKRINGYEKQYRTWIAEVDRLFANGLDVMAIEKTRELLRTYPKDPLLLYLLARANMAAGDYEEARTLFTGAKDLDPMPWRALTQFNRAIRKLAEVDGVVLVDAEKRFQEQAMHGLVGFSLIADNCHPTPIGNAIIAKEIISVMKQKRLFVERDLRGMSINDALERFLSETAPVEKRRSLEFAYLLENAKYSMKTPFLNFTASKMYLDRALAMDSSNWQIWANFATLAFLENHIEEGRKQLRKAIELRGAMIDPTDRGSTPYLLEALKEAGIRLEDFRKAG